MAIGQQDTADLLCSYRDARTGFPDERTRSESEVGHSTSKQIHIIPILRKQPSAIVAYKTVSHKMNSDPFAQPEGDTCMASEREHRGHVRRISSSS